MTETVLSGSLVVAQGQFACVLRPSDLEAFCLALGAGTGSQPRTFAIRLLSEPPVADALKALVAKSGAALFHEGQSFSIEQPLPVDENITVSFSIRREISPPRLVVDLEASDAQGQRLQSLTATLRLVMPAGLENAGSTP